MQNKEHDSLMFSLDPNSNPASPAPPELYSFLHCTLLKVEVITKRMESSRLMSFIFVVVVVPRLCWWSFCDHWKLISRASAQLLDEDNFPSQLVLSGFRTTTGRQNILPQMPRVLKSSSKLAFKRKSC